MGGNMVRRLLRHGHECVVFDANAANVTALIEEGAKGAASLTDFIEKLETPRVVWVMLPAAAVDPMVNELTLRLSPGDIIVDGGNSYYVDDIRRAWQLAPFGIEYVDVGTSGGVWGLERGYCLMIGGSRTSVARLDPIFKSLAPGVGAAPRTPGRTDGPDTAEAGYLHCGPSGAGHFVKMIHNGIEYGLMEAYAEGLNILKHANAGSAQRTIDAETTPHRNPEHYQYKFDLPAIAEVWRRGSVVASWLLDLTAAALYEHEELRTFSECVSDSGEGRWTILAAIEESVPAPVLSAAVFQRFASRGEADFANRVLSAMRNQFGGHAERPAAELAGSRS
jgi:6-phosphogluconate dehydrogenase